MIPYSEDLLRFYGPKVSSQKNLQKIVQPKKNGNSLFQIENKKSIKMKTSLGDIV